MAGIWGVLLLLCFHLAAPPLVVCIGLDQHFGKYGKQSGSVLQALLDSQLSDMVELIEKASMLQPLENLVGSGAKLTIFAPQNTELHPMLKTFLLKPSNANLLKRVVQFHVVTARLTASEWSNTTFASLSSDPLSFSSYHSHKNATLMVEDTSIVAPDYIVREDGVVHGIDGMLLPSSVRSEFVAVSTGKLHTPLPTGAPGLAAAAAGYVSSWGMAPTGMPVSAPSPFSAPSPGPAPGPSVQPRLGIGDEEVQTFLTAMARFGGYTEFAELLGSLTSLGAEISRLLNEGYKLTILAPTDAAVKELTAEQLNSQVILELILHYHVISEYQTEESMYSTVRRMGRSEFNTLRYPLTLSAQEADGTVQFGEGKHSALVFDHDIYADGRVSVQGIDKVLIPPDLQAQYTSSTETKGTSKRPTERKLISTPDEGEREPLSRSWVGRLLSWRW